ncbi:class C sortase [Leifsonia aquatica]|uniref:class C sortase n=1 Tax=Leifsonia aquatica TaxID=144185 RepID=UPI0037F9BAD1
MPHEPESVPRHSQRAPRRRWRPGLLAILTAVAAVAGISTLAYSPAASWISSYNQSLIVDRYTEAVATVEPTASEQLAEARAYNAALSSGALLPSGANVPTGNGTSSDHAFDYWKLLATRDGTMSRIQIPSIGVDLPIYHGTSDKTLLTGAGHLEGTSLPVGGADTHAVITAHRGLADATMFTDLDRVKKGDRFVLTTFGEVLTYRVVDTRVVEPGDTATLRQEAGRDLVTLVTCTPLGINSHRILVTGERILPTPDADVAAARGSVGPAPFPWWLVLYITGLAAVGLYLWWAGREPRRTEC